MKDGDADCQGGNRKGKRHDQRETDQANQPEGAAGNVPHHEIADIEEGHGQNQAEDDPLGLLALKDGGMTAVANND